MNNQTMVNWESTVYEAMPRFEQIAEQSKLVKWAAESQFALQAVERNNSLAKCHPPTVQDAIINVAAVELTLNPADGYAYLVPEYNSQTKRQECQLRISFKGFVKVATDGGPIKIVKAEVVKANDDFEYNGPLSHPDHKMNPFKDRGASVGVYCIALLNSGEVICDVMDWAEVQKCRKAAKFDSVWSLWEDEMAKKSIVKRAAKMWPRGNNDSRLNQTIEVINESEGSPTEYEMLKQTAEDIIEAIESDEPSLVDELWSDASEQEQKLLWKAKSKGGFFTQDEKTYIRETRYSIVNPDKIEELAQAMAEKRTDWSAVKLVLESEYHSGRGANTEFEFDTLAVGYCVWAISQVEKMELAV